MPESNGRPVGDPIVVVVVDVVVVDVLVVVVDVLVDVKGVPIDAVVDAGGDAVSDDEQAAATRIDAATRPNRLRRIGPS
jgi:hypothetical protein